MIERVIREKIYIYSARREIGIKLFEPNSSIMMLNQKLVRENKSKSKKSVENETNERVKDYDYDYVETKKYI